MISSCTAAAEISQGVPVYECLRQRVLQRRLRIAVEDPGARGPSMSLLLPNRAAAIAHYTDKFLDMHKTYPACVLSGWTSDCRQA